MTDFGAVARAPVESCLSSTAEIIDELRNGRMVVLVDADDRENEGDLVIPAQMATPDAVNFMVTHGRGLVCLALTQARAADLRLAAMVRKNASRNRTAFTVSIEARDGITTGISAGDRARTIATAIDPTKDASDIASPGHIFPLVARDGGALVRAGHTEASVDLARLAGLYPAAVICEIMNDDGSMARLPDLIPFARRHGLKIGAIHDLIVHRMRHERLVQRVGRATVESDFGGVFDLAVYETTVEPGEHVALIKGDLAAPGPVLVRVHAVNAPGDLLGVHDPTELASPIQRAMETIAVEGRGVVVVIRDLRPHALANWLTQRNLHPHQKPGARERRQVEIGIGSQILRDLGVTDMILLTNSSPHVYSNVEAFGLHIADSRRLG